ncbi:lecithin retinol acyltransferase family protein [Laribacter hongkongensis]|uniref:lecithin retinol acyltransferase family protein n=1 Tax=Laribacter hongkongensis TaxID=168471 RepID=UPI001EFE378D|nr:lecithin retinol acyltransferase family protein [Laribacter hongkongensis]MCG9053034.1 lecithin retinol acyltransferase family protein [Laribacter hongkongensis]
MDGFCAGQSCRVQPHPHRRHDAAASIRRAYRRMHEQGYSLLFNNCEHFVTWCIEGTSGSSQVRNAAVVTASVPAAVALSRIRPVPVRPDLVQVAASQMTAPGASAGSGTAVVALTGSATAAGLLATPTTGAVLTTGLLATSAAPVALAVATGAAVGWGIRKLWEQFD